MTYLSNQIQKSDTWREIHAHPDIWRAWSNDFSVEAYISCIAQLDINEVWFYVEASSAYIADISAVKLPNTGGIRFLTIPSNDFASHVLYYLRNPPNNLLIVNISRSGNSVEALNTISTIEVLVSSLPTLNITCNSNGALYKSAVVQFILLPDAYNDAGFAITFSFPTTLLTRLSIFDAGADARNKIRRLAEHADATLPILSSQAIGSKVPSRAFSVGSGSIAFAASESARKVMEVIAGKIPHFGILYFFFTMVRIALYLVETQFTRSEEKSIPQESMRPVQLRSCLHSFQRLRQ